MKARWCTRSEGWTVAWGIGPGVRDSPGEPGVTGLSWLVDSFLALVSRTTYSPERSSLRVFTLFNGLHSPPPPEGPTAAVYT